MKAVEIIALIFGTMALVLVLVGWLDSRYVARLAAERALRMGTVQAIDDALALHKMPRGLRRHLEERRDELRVDEVIRS